MLIPYQINPMVSQAPLEHTDLDIVDISDKLLSHDVHKALKVGDASSDILDSPDSPMATT